MKVTRAGAFVVTAASMSTFTSGYSFTDDNPAIVPREASNLATNEKSSIYGGSEGNIDNYPFLASLRDPFLGIHICSGALIASEYIITAAHCIGIMEFVACFGTNSSINFDPENGALQVPVIKQYRHPLYNINEHYYDVGMLKLARPVKRKMAKLCARDGSDNKKGTVASVPGWGRTEDAILSPVLEEITIPIISNAECNKFKKYVGRLTDTMLCAGTGNGTDTCNGDSGSPLVVKGNILVGCVSWGGTCGVQAGVFTRLASVMDYIENVLAGGDGSKFDVMSSTSSSLEEEKSSLSSPHGSPNGIKKIASDETPDENSPEPLSSSDKDIMSWLLQNADGDKVLNLLNSNPGMFDKKSSDSGNEDTVRVKVEKAPVASKALKSTKTPIEEPLAEPERNGEYLAAVEDSKAYKSTEAVVDEPPFSDSMSPPASSDLVLQSDLVHQNDQESV